MYSRFCRQVFMYLEPPTLDISFRVKYEDVYYMVYANSGNLKCFECGDVGQSAVSAQTGGAAT